MATAVRTTDHDEIRRWVESKNGHPAIVKGTGGVLRIDFGQPEETLEPIDWDRFFDIFERQKLSLLYDPNGYMVKFVERDDMAARNGRKTSARGRKKSTNGRKTTARGGRKKSAGTRRKTTGTRKKTTGTRKKATGRKKTAGRKKSTAGRKKTTGTRKKTTRGRKKGSGRKYSPRAGRKVERTMHEMKRGELESGRSGKKVKSRKQAIAIGLSEARRSGEKVPPSPSRRKSSSRKRSR